MDHQTRNEFEHLCALAEIEHDPEKFLEIKRKLIHLLDEKQIRLNRQWPAGSLRDPNASSNVA
jgi:hypothetical protein